jgi:hypothetical protein
MLGHVWSLGSHARSTLLIDPPSIPQPQFEAATIMAVVAPKVITTMVVDV